MCKCNIISICFILTFSRLPSFFKNDLICITPDNKYKTCEIAFENNLHEVLGLKENTQLENGEMVFGDYSPLLDRGVLISKEFENFQYVPVKGVIFIQSCLTYSPILVNN